jgi:hypothetical protein
MRRTKAIAIARLTLVSNPETAAVDRVLKLSVIVPATHDNGDDVLKTVLNGFEDTIGLIGHEFCEYKNDTGSLQTGQVIRVSKAKPPVRPQPPPPKPSLWERIKNRLS